MQPAQQRGRAGCKLRPDRRYDYLVIILNTFFIHAPVTRTRFNFFIKMPWKLERTCVFPPVLQNGSQSFHQRNVCSPTSFELFRMVAGENRQRESFSRVDILRNWIQYFCNLGIPYHQPIEFIGRNQGESFQYDNNTLIILSFTLLVDNQKLWQIPNCDLHANVCLTVNKPCTSSFRSKSETY